MNNRQKLPLGSPAVNRKSNIGRIDWQPHVKDKMEGAIARNCELQLQKNQKIHLQHGLAVSVGCIFAPWRNCD